MQKDPDTNGGIATKAERTRAEVADRKPEGGEDRPGFDLGGASQENRENGPKNTTPGGPRSGPVPGGAAKSSGGGTLGSSGSGPTDGTGGAR